MARSTASSQSQPEPNPRSKSQPQPQILVTSPSFPPPPLEPLAKTNSPPPPPRPKCVYLSELVLVRLVNAAWLVTFFQPDEFFQSLEPAWQLAFGPDSGAWLTWEWHHQLRSSLHPFIFSGAYIIADRISRLLVYVGGVNLHASLLIAAPRVLQAFFAALGDWYTFRLAASVYGTASNASIFALLLQVFSPWQWYVSTRTFSNSLETTLTVMALYYWPWELLSSTAAPHLTKENPKKAPSSCAISLARNSWPARASLALAAVAVVLRPTNVLIWVPIAMVTLVKAAALRGPSVFSSPAVVLIREALLCGGLVLGVSLVADRLYFGFWTFPPYRWLTFNVSKSLAVFYGRNPWHYYLLQGVPLLCTTSLPFALYALYRALRSPEAITSPNTWASGMLRLISLAAIVTNFALSLISHKEVRFIYPLLPIFNVLAAPWAASFFTTSPPISPPSAASPSTKKALRLKRHRLRNKRYLVAALSINVFLAGYLSMLHQPAPLSVLHFLRTEFERIHGPILLDAAALSPPSANDELFALFLTPCHSTPWRSHLVHPDLRAYALTCEPPLHTAPGTIERESYRDEADRFYDNPVGFLKDELFRQGRGLPVPRYIVGFPGIEPWINEFLETSEGRALGMRPRRVWGRFNGFFNEDWRRAGRMLVWDTGVYDGKALNTKTL